MVEANMTRVVILVSAFALVFVLAGTFLLRNAFQAEPTSAEKAPDLLVGVDIAYGNLTAVKSQIDQVSPFTNFIVVGCTNITYSTDTLNDVCKYIFERNLYFMVYTELPLKRDWVSNATALWGNRFLGLYVWDEPGGKQLDLAGEQAIVNSTDHASNYVEVETMFTNILSAGIKYTSHYGSTTMPIATSDYALYWFDYKAGYDALFAQLGWNYSRALNIDLVRGAATVQNKSWGVIVTWTYTAPPYIESGEQLYVDMKFAYDSGAKYILIFDSNKGWTQGILQQEHLQAMQRFWDYTKANPRTAHSATERVAYVLPEHYAYGFRGPEDKIWGLFPADILSSPLCIDLNNVMEQYGNRLDIIYDDHAFPKYASFYGQLKFWNGTSIGG
jgi:hypothetical protein